MPTAVWTRTESEQRNLEYNYLALSYQITALIEQRGEERKLIEALAEVANEVELYLAAEPGPIERASVAQLLENAAGEAASFLGLSLAASAYTDQLLRLHLDLAGLGGLLGYQHRS
jgi:uncharacterized protein YhaN